MRRLSEMIYFLLLCNVLFSVVLSQVQIPDAPSIPSNTVPTSFPLGFEKDLNQTFSNLKALNDSLSSSFNTSQVNSEIAIAMITTLWKSLFFDPLIYASLIRKEYCPGIVPQTDKCIYPATPNREPIAWTCPPGNYCMSARWNFKCTAGFYCPINSIQPIYCPPGHVCSKDAIWVQKCPYGYFCPIGSTEPFFCTFPFLCPEGTEDTTRILLIPIVVIITLVLLLIQYLNEYIDKKRATVHQQEAGLLKASRITALEQKKNNNSLEITFENLDLILPTGLKILDNVSGVFKKGRMCAIMGPSGSGKTTLLSVLMGTAKKTSGRLLINDIAGDLSTHKRMVGYVPQEDIMLRELSVRQILLHSGSMRLPKSWPERKVKEKVLETIVALDLGHVIDSAIGNEEHRGISGGQRKRVNIGMELVAEPAVLFLDEPTSGLDSSTSLEVCRILQRITKIRLLTVAAVIHSPSLATFLEFDDLLLLGKGGKVIYFGPTDKIEGYLDLIGFTRASSQTIPDFIMEVVAGKVNSRLDTEFEPSDLPLYWVVYNEKTEATVSSPDSFPSEISSSIVRPQSIKRIKKRRTKFLSRAISVVYTQSHPLQDMKIALSNFWADVTRKRDPQQDTYVFFGQFYYLWFRSAAQDFQNLTNLMTDYVLHFTVGVIISIGVSRSFTLAGLPAELCWTQAVQLMPVCNSMMSTYRGVSPMISAGIMFAALSTSGNTFGSEWVVHERESRSGTSTLAYFFAKAAFDIPKVAIYSTAYMAGFTSFYSMRQPLMGLWIYMLMLYVSTWFMGYFVSITVSKQTRSVVNVALALFWGFVAIGNPPIPEFMQTPYTSWLIPLAASRWFNEAVYHRELMALPFRDIFVTDYGMEKTIVVEAPPRMLTIAAIWMALTMAVMIYKRWQ